MKNFLLLAIAAAAIQAQAAGSVNFDMRTDLLSQKYNDAAVAGGVAGTDNYSFRLQTARIDYKGSLNEKTSFRARARLAGKDQGAMEKRDNSNITLDHASGTYKFSDMIQLTMGKTSSDIGGFEGNSAGPELYYTSETYSGGGFLGTSQAGAPADKLKLSGYQNLIYATGAKLGFIIDSSNTISLMAFDLDANTGRGRVVLPGTSASDQLQGTTLSQNKSLLGISYFGNFMDKTLAVIASYHAQTIGDNGDTNSNFTDLSLGYTVGAFVIQADYNINTYNSILGAFKPKDTLTSTNVRLVYNIDPSLALQVKASTSQENFDTTTVVSSSNKYTGYGAALEWRPKAEDVFRYHAAYQARNETPDNGGDSRQLAEFIVGMRINGDFLK